MPGLKLIPNYKLLLKSGPDPTNQKCLEVVFTVCKVLTYSTVVVFQALLSPCHRCSLCMNCECCFWHYNTKQVYIATGWVVLIHCSSNWMGINASKPHSFLLEAARPRGWGCVTRVVNLITHAWFNFCTRANSLEFGSEDSAMAECTGNPCSPDRREITRGSRRGPFQGHVVALEARHRGDHRRSLQTSIREWRACELTRRQDSTSHLRSVINPAMEC